MIPSFLDLRNLLDVAKEACDLVSFASAMRFCTGLCCVPARGILGVRRRGFNNNDDLLAMMTKP